LRVLGLRGNESIEEVKRVYRKLALTLHPDTHANASPEEQQATSNKFQEVTRAYQALVA
jgi:DnaJ-class molecular chaperone